MRVHIDEAGTHDEAGGIQGLSRVFLQRAGLDDRHNAAVTNANVGGVRGRTSAVHDGGSDNSMIKHDVPRQFINRLEVGRGLKI